MERTGTKLRASASTPKLSAGRRETIQVDEKVPLLKGIPLSLQHLFAMFGASVLVPILFNQAAGTTVVDPALVLLMNGIGTLIYTFVCRGKAPAFLGSSFAFIAPTITCISLAKTPGIGFQHALGGFVVARSHFRNRLAHYPHCRPRVAQRGPSAGGDWADCGADRVWNWRRLRRIWPFTRATRSAALPH